MLWVIGSHRPSSALFQGGRGKWRGMLRLTGSIRPSSALFQEGGGKVRGYCV